MRILVLTREFPPHVLGGISYHLANIYGRISDLGHEVTVIAGKCKECTIERVGIPDSLSVHRIPFGSRRGHHVRFPVALYRFLTDFDISQYDVALGHAPIPFELDVPLVTKYHDCVYEERLHASERPYHLRALDVLVDRSRKYVDQHSFDCSDNVVFNSELCRRAWQSRFDVRAESTVVYNGVDTDLFAPRSTDDDGYVLFVGNSERKGLPTVLEFANRSDFPVYLAGPDEVYPRNATALGRVSQQRLAELYSGAIATIHPTHFEAFGNVVLESLACGTPVVTTKDCGAAELLDKTCGAITDDLEHGIQRVENVDPDDCVSVAEQYTWDVVAEATLEVARSSL